jgi:hypothetical protein
MNDSGDDQRPGCRGVTARAASPSVPPASGFHRYIVAPNRHDAIGYNKR